MPTFDVAKLAELLFGALGLLGIKVKPAEDLPALPAAPPPSRPATPPPAKPAA